MTQLPSRLYRAYREGGIREVARRTYNRYLEDHAMQTSLFVRYQIHKERDRIDRLVTDLEQEGVGTRLTRSDLLPHKTSNTLFVLASGGSINQITDSQWKTIEKHDSIGLNRWPIHDFVPTYYVFELPVANQEREQTFFEMLLYNKEKYSNTPTIIKDIDRTIDSIKYSDISEYTAGDLLLSRDSTFAEFGTKEEQQRLLKWLSSHGHFSTSRSLALIYRVRASISYTLHLGSLLGYEKIVLCGVDMVNSEYFFMEDAYTSSDVPIPHADITDTSNPHPTNDPQQDARITLEELIYMMEEVALEPNGIELFVENTLSALHPRIPKYQYD